MGFGYVTEPECRAEFGLDKTKGHVLIANGPILDHKTYTPLDDPLLIDSYYLSSELVNAIVRGTPRWSERAYSAINDHSKIGIIYLMDEKSFEEIETHKDDWRLILMSEISILTQKS